MKRADGIPQVVLTFSLNNKQISHPIVENLYIHVYSTFSLQHILTLWVVDAVEAHKTS